MINLNTGNNLFKHFLPTTFQMSPLGHIFRVSALATAIFTAQQASSFVKVKNERANMVLQSAIYLTSGILSIGAAIKYLKFSLVEVIAGVALSFIGHAVVGMMNEMDEDESYDWSSESNEESGDVSTSQESGESEISTKPKKMKAIKKPDRSAPVKLTEGYKDEASMYKDLLKNHPGIWFGVPAHKNDRDGFRSFLEHMKLFKDSGVKKIYIQCTSDDHCNELSEMLKNAKSKPIKSKVFNKIVSKAEKLGIDLEPIEQEKGDITSDSEKYVILAPVHTQYFVKETQKNGIKPLAHRLQIPSVYVHSEFRITETEIETNRDRGKLKYEVIKDNQPKTKLIYDSLLKKSQGFLMEMSDDNDFKFLIEELDQLKKLGVKKLYMECESPESCKNCLDLFRKAQKEPKKYKVIASLKQKTKKLGIEIETLDYTNGSIKKDKNKYVILGLAAPKPDIEVPSYRTKISVINFNDRATVIPLTDKEKTSEFKTQALGVSKGPLQLNVSAIVARYKPLNMN